MGERHVRIEISDFVMRTFVPRGKTAGSADTDKSSHARPARRISYEEESV